MFLSENRYPLFPEHALSSLSIDVAVAQSHDIVHRARASFVSLDGDRGRAWAHVAGDILHEVIVKSRRHRIASQSGGRASARPQERTGGATDESDERAADGSDHGAEEIAILVL